MFDTLGAGAIARDFGLVGGSRSGVSEYRGNYSGHVGAVAGINEGLIYKVYSTTRLYAREPATVGGLVGRNTGTIRQSL